MSQHDLSPQSSAVEAIRHYLSVQPQAVDSAEGVHHWWIRWDGVPAPLEVTVAALEQLEREGELERIRFGVRELWRRRAIAADRGRTSPASEQPCEPT